MAEPELILQNINQLDEVNSASSTDVLILTDKASNNATIIDYPDFVSTLLDELQSKNFDLNSGRQTLLNALNSLNTRLNNITAGEGTESVRNAEIIDARTTEATLVTDHLVEASYPTLGEAIRAQINALYDEIKNNNSAENLAQQAKQVADIAKQMAENATNSASIANTKAEEALANSQTAITTANTAETKSEEAKTVASTAGTQSTTALTNSQTALTNSQNALTSAQEAVTTANASNAIASQASVDATDAKEIAEGADDKADQALAQSAQAIESAETATLLSEEARDESQQARVRSTDAEDIARQAREIADGASVIANGANDISEENARVVASMDARINQANSTASQALATSNSANDLAEFTNSRLDSVNDNIQNVNNKIATKVDDMLVEEGLIYLVSDGEIVAGPFGPFAGGSGGGGGGGSDSNNAVVRMQNSSGWSSKKIAYGSECPISVTWSSLEDDLPTGNGTMTIQVNGVTKVTKDVAQGLVTIDIGGYLSVGSNTIKVSVKDVYQNGKTLILTVNTINIQITSSFDSSVPYTGEITFTYTPIGDMRKTVHFILDNEEVGTVNVTVSNRQQSYVIPALTHGAHTFKVYFDGEVEGETLTSNELYYEIIFIAEGDDRTIVASDYSQTEVVQYSNVVIPYSVYDPNSLTAEVQIKVNNNIVSTQTVSRDKQTFSYRAEQVGALQIAFTSNGTTKAINLTVTATDADIDAETDSLVLLLKASGRSNNEEHPDTWVYEDVECSFTGFNWSSDGWQMDEDGATFLRMSNNARLTIPYKIFGSDFRATGKTIEIEFDTKNILNYDAILFTNMSGGKGIEITPQKATFKSEQSTISTQFKEDEHVRLSFVVEKRTSYRLIYIYINAIMSGVIQYPESDDFEQSTPADIVVGASDATIDLYAIRVYNNALTSQQIVSNWIADTQNVDDMLARYERNNIYDAYGNVTIEKLPTYLPYMVLQGAQTPQYKGNKMNMDGYYVDREHPNKSFTFSQAQVDVQGTSSQYYSRKNYKIKFNNGFDMNNGEHVSKLEFMDGAIPTKTYTFKADVASSEGANNVVLAMLYDETAPYKTPAQEKDSRVRQGIAGFPIVMFWDNGEETVFLGKYNWNNDKGTEEVFGYKEGDESWEVKNNTSDRVLFKSDDFTSMGVDEDGKPVPAWLNDFEARYPEDNTNYTKLKRVLTWTKSTDTTQATNETLAEPVTYPETVTDPDTGEVTVVDHEYTVDNEEYRLAKFRNEFEDYFWKDAYVFYYLFTEHNLLVDSRAKNMFPSIVYDDNMETNGMYSPPYDMDTALGTNNEGTLSFTYGLEDIDKVNGKDVFNGQPSVLFVNMRKTMFSSLRAMYQNLRSTGAWSYEKFVKRFEDHQSKWSEAIFNEDALAKYIQPLIDDGDLSYLPMVQGKKEMQRKWFLYNQFRYDDSKYQAGDAQTDVITLRGYAKDNITVVPYADIYATIKYGSYLVSTRAKHNQNYTLENPLDNVNDTEIYIYSASQLKSVGDLSGLKVGYADFTKAKNLQALKIGQGLDSVESITTSQYPWETNGGDLTFRSTNYQIASSESSSYWFFKAPTDFTLTMKYQVSSQSSYDKLTIQINGVTKVNGISGNGSVQTLNTQVNAGDIITIYATYVKNASTNSNQDRSFITFSGLPTGYTMWKDEMPSDIINNNLEVLNLGNNVLLKTIDARNCPNLTQSIDMSGCVSLEEIDFRGSGITGASLPNGGNLRIIKYPETLTNLTVRNQKNLITFSIPSYNNITTVWLENNSSVINTRTIFDSVQTGSRIRMIGVNWSITSSVTATQNFIDRIKSMRGLDEQGNNTEYPQITGKAYFTIMTGDQYNELHSICPNLEITYGTLQWNVYYYNEDGSTLYQTKQVSNGSNTSTYTPSKTSTAKYSYTFKGWATEPYEPFAEAEDYDATLIDVGALKNVTSNRNIYAVFQPVIRTYTVTFKNGSTTLQTKTVQYGQDAEYTGAEPTDSSGKVFDGWNPEPINIVANTTCNAVFIDLPYIKIINKNYQGMTVQSSTVETIRHYCFYNYLVGSNIGKRQTLSLSLPKIKTIQSNQSIYLLQDSINAPFLETIGDCNITLVNSNGANRSSALSSIQADSLMEYAGSFYGFMNFDLSLPSLKRIALGTTNTALNVGNHDIFLPNLETLYYGFYGVNARCLYMPKLKTLMYNSSLIFATSKSADGSGKRWDSYQCQRVYVSNSLTHFYGGSFYSNYSTEFVIQKNQDNNRLVSLYDAPSANRISNYQDNNIRIFVPDEQYNDYLVATNWSLMTDFLHPISELPDISTLSYGEG